MMLLLSFMLASWRISPRGCQVSASISFLISASLVLVKAIKTYLARKMMAMEKNGKEPEDLLPMRSLLVLVSYHHKNTEKIARVIANVLDAQIMAPQQLDIKELQGHGLIGFGSGIYSGKHHEALLSLADVLPPVTNKKAFIFSTSAMMGEAKVAGDHALLREKLRSKGYTIVGEFSCKGFNTNSFLKYLGGMNKGKPDADDLMRAETFARDVLVPVT
jgi:flavodoxin